MAYVSSTNPRDSRSCSRGQSHSIDLKSLPDLAWHRPMREVETRVFSWICWTCVEAHHFSSTRNFLSLANPIPVLLRFDSNLSLSIDRVSEILIVPESMPRDLVILTNLQFYIRLVGLVRAVKWLFGGRQEAGQMRWLVNPCIAR